MIKKIWQWFVRNSFWGLLRVLRFVPWKPALAWATAMGSLGYYLSARYRRVADKNLRIAYGDTMTELDRRRLTKRVFQHFARCGLVEFFKSAVVSPDEIRRMVSDEKFKEIDGIIADGKGMIFLTAHIGNWEMLARRAGIDGYRLAVVARQSPDPGMNRITDFIRKSGGYEVFPRGESPREILKHLRSGGVLAILPDQKSEDIFVPFFGRLTGTVAGPAVLALKTGAPIVMMFCVHAPDGSFIVERGADVDITSTGDRDADIHRIMTDVNAEVERIIRKYPEQWLWLHDRWRAPVPEHLLKREDEAVAVGK